jgi:hypothetical protein
MSGPQAATSRRRLNTCRYFVTVGLAGSGFGAVYVEILQLPSSGSFRMTTLRRRGSSTASNEVKRPAAARF